MLAHSTVAFQITRSTSHILVLRKVAVPLLTKRRDNLTSVFLKHGIELLLLAMASADCLETQGRHCSNTTQKTYLPTYLIQSLSASIHASHSPTGTSSSRNTWYACFTFSVAGTSIAASAAILI